MEKLDLRKLDEQEILGIRKSAMRLIESGMSQKAVCEKLCLRPNTLNDWSKKYKSKGVKGLHSGKRGARSEDRKLLSSKVERQIQKMIIDKMPEQLKLDYALWTRKAVKELVEREFGIVISISAMGVYLRKWGFTPQSHKEASLRTMPEESPKMVRMSTPLVIKKQAKEEDAEIFWGETGIKTSVITAEVMHLRGKHSRKKSMSKRFSVNMVSAVNNQGKVHFMIYSESMNADRLIEFMTQLIKANRRMVYLILDNLRVHHSKIVKEWVERNKEKIALYYLPSYSPERNPDEYLNCDLKQGMSAKKSPKNKETLQNNVQNHMEMLSVSPQRVMKYFKHRDIQYAA
ncbi:MAG: IS630 family transposase [Chitinophagales bacterium]|nr:IS630 family transposase [Chitinophagales bacterium]